MAFLKKRLCRKVLFAQHFLFHFLTRRLAERGYFNSTHEHHHHDQVTVISDETRLSFDVETDKLARNNKPWRCFEKGDISVLLVLMGIATFCLGYYYTRDWRYEIQLLIT